MRSVKTIVGMRGLLVSGLVVVFVFAAACSASASQLDDKRAQAASVQRQIDGLNNQAEIASENYNNASAKYNALTGQVHATERKIASIKAHQGHLQSQLDTRANALYRQGPLGLFPVLLNSRSFSDFDATWQMLVNMGHSDAQTVSALKQAKIDAQAAHTKLVVAQTGARRQQAAMAANKQAVLTHLAQQKTLLANVNADILALVVQQREAEAAAARRAAAALLAAQAAEDSHGDGSNDSGPVGGLSGAPSDGGPAPSGRGAAAVYWAMKALGKPYRWGASGPNSFDCSGLCMWAYGHVGVHLPHYSRAQYESGSHVSRGNLEPGDLVFFGSPIHHVGMYVGRGMFIEAPYTGCDVRISSLSHRSDYAGACRP